MARKTCMAACAAVLALCGAAQAQPREYRVTVTPVRPAEGFQKIHVSKAALGSAEIVLWGGAAIDPDCSEHPGATLTVVRPPEHGTVKVVEGPLWVAFPAGNPRAACNSNKVPGRQAFYAAQAGFTGHDKVVLQGSSADGHVREVTVDVLVR